MGKALLGLTLAGAPGRLDKRGIHGIMVSGGWFSGRSSGLLLNPQIRECVNIKEKKIKWPSVIVSSNAKRKHSPTTKYRFSHRRRSSSEGVHYRL